MRDTIGSIGEQSDRRISYASSRSEEREIVVANALELIAHFLTRKEPSIPWPPLEEARLPAEWTSLCADGMFMMRADGVSATSRKGSFGRTVRTVIALAALALAAFLIDRTLSRYTLEQILQSIGSIPTSRVAMSVACAAASYACLTGFDWLALRYVDRRLPYRYVALASFCSLSLGHNIGFAALSSGAIRYRFYSRFGVGLGDIAKVILFCGVTVGLGLIILAGLALVCSSVLASEMTGLSRPMVLGIGGACLGLALSYVGLARIVRRPIRIRGWSLELPPWQLALGQVIIGPLNFAFVAAALYHVLADLGDVSYPQVATAYVIGLGSSLLAHAPGGLGVLETVLMFLIPGEQIIGGLIAFRVVYFFIPLLIGAPLFALSEIAFRRMRPIMAS
jgi:glycosyltransferase 2 family protein